jgi:hypothetical protein
LLEDLPSLLFIPVGAEEDKILIKEILEFRILVKLLTQQSAAPSATREEIKEDPFVLALGLSHSLVESAFEPVLGAGQGSEQENERK